MRWAVARPNQLWHLAVRADRSTGMGMIEEAFTCYESERRGTAMAMGETSKRNSNLVLVTTRPLLVGWMSQRPALNRLTQLMAHGQSLNYLPPR